MAIDFKDIATVADQLHSLGTEPSSRSASSRYYYAALHGAEWWLDKTPGMPSAGSADGGLHTVVEGKLKNLDPKAPRDQKIKGRSLAVRLIAMKARRVTCDYKLAAMPTVDDFAQQRADAHKFLADCVAPPP